MARHNRRLTTKQTALGIDATVGDPTHDRFQKWRVILSHRDIIEKEQWFSPRTQHVVHAHGDQIDTDRMVLACPLCHLKLRTYTIGTRHEDRLFVVPGKQRFGEV